MERENEKKSWYYSYCFIFSGIVYIFIYFQLIGDYIGATALFMVFAFIVLVVARKGRKK